MAQKSDDPTPNRRKPSRQTPKSKQPWSKAEDRHALFMQALLQANPTIFDSLKNIDHIQEVVGFPSKHSAHDYICRFKKSIRDGRGGRVQGAKAKKGKVQKEAVANEGEVVALDVGNAEEARPMGGLLEPSWWAEEKEDGDDDGEQEGKEEGVEVVKTEPEIWRWTIEEEGQVVKDGV